MADVLIERNYVDNFAVKEYVTDSLVDKYFEDVDLDLRSVSLLGYTTELITNISEDSFNTGSVLFRESFPNRAQIDESIYSHGAIFQMDEVFSVAATCRFLLVVEEEAILKNMVDYKDPDNKNTYHFYIDKNTTIYIEDIPFTLDYDIMMTIAKRVTEEGEDYLFSARYVMEQYKNSISEVTDPYVKIRRSSDGYIALEVQTHQCTRETQDETIITNSELNYPVYDIEYKNQIAGFDVLYKGPSDEDFVQMETLIAYSQALKQPFCYYQMMNENTIRISFNSKDTFFMPEFNSNLRVILYLTNGEQGNFDTYEGVNISLVPNTDVYSYANSYLTAAKPIGAAKKGQDQQGIEVLQALTVEQYRTANALTTDNDLKNFFNNYKYRYGNAYVQFIKKRDDVFERIFSAFMIINNGEFIYKTNTLNLDINLYDMKNVDKDVFIIEPGTVFTANETDGFASFFINEDKEKTYRLAYKQAILNGDSDVKFIEDTDMKDVPEYLVDRNCSYAQFKQRRRFDSSVSVWDLTDEDYAEYDNPQENKFLLINPFLIRFTKQPKSLMTTYLTHIENVSAVDFTDQNDDMYLQFVMYTFYLTRNFTKERKYEAHCSIAPTMAVDIGKYPLLQRIIPEVPGGDEEEEADVDEENPNYVLGDRFSLDKNDFRVVMAIMDGNDMLCYTEMIPTDYNGETGNFTFSATLYTDDHITPSGKLRLLEDTIYRNEENGNYYKVHDNDNTLYNLYDTDGNILEEDISSDEVQELYDEGELKRWDNIVNTYVHNDILIPIDDCEVKIYMLYKRNYSETGSGLVENLSSQTNHPFMAYDTYNPVSGTWEKFDKYIWTNEYSTNTEPVAFIRSLKSVRSFFDFSDFTEATLDEEGNVVFTHDIMDIIVKSISFIRASTVLDSTNMYYFFNVFYQNYLFMQDIISTKLRNETTLDIKFYNTYGRSRDFIVGESTDVLNTVNLKIYFEMWFVVGTDTLVAVPEVKRFIKSEIEKVNANGMNNLYISNLMRKIENTFAYVDHIRFNQINNYDTTYQAVKNYVTDLNDLTVEERRWYVPEILVVDLDDIIITEYLTA